MALPLIGALAGLGRVAAGTTARRVGYGAALGDLAKDAVVGAGKGFVGGLKGAMMTEAPGLTGAYAFGKELKKRANASRGNASPPSPTNKSSSSTPVIGGLGSLNTTSIVVGQKQSNIINLEQVRQLKQLNDSVINQSKLIAYQIDDTRRKNQFAEEAANEQAIRDDKLLEAIRNIGGGGKNGKGGAAANDSSGGGFLSSLLGGAAGGAISKLVPLLSGAMAALPWARILRLATPVGAAAAAVTTPGFGRSTPDAKSAQAQSDFYVQHKTKIAQQRAAEEAKDIPRPKLAGIAQRQWNEKYEGRRDPGTGKRLSGIYDMPVDGTVSSVYGKRESTKPGMSTDHKGVDFDITVGEPIYSIAPGTVKSLEKTGSKLGLGRFVEIDHGNGVISKYGHLSKVSVSAGQAVGPGILLGESGGDPSDSGSGISTGAHLHLETTNHGVPINPADLAGLAILKNKGAGVKLSSAAGLPPAVTAAATSPAAGNSPAQSSAATGGKKSNIISSTAKSNAGPLAEYYKENDAKIGAIKAENAAKKRSEFKNSIIKSLSGKSLDELTLLKKQIESPRLTPQYQSLDASDKSEVLKAIDKEIEKKTVPVVSKSVALGGELGGQLSEAQIAAMIPDFSQRYPGVQYASLDTGTRSDAGGGGGSNFEVKKEVVQTNDDGTQKLIGTLIDANGYSSVTGQAKVTGAGYQGNPLLAKAFKPLFKSNSDILQDVNKAFLRELRGTFTSIFNTGLTEALFPKGPGVSAGEAGRDDMYRGQKLQSIFGTNEKINEATTKLLGKQYGPMFAPLFNNLAQGYLEVGSRVAGKAIFQGIGDLGAKETMTLTGQVLGNYAAGNKKLAFEQLLYGASGGAKSGIALGPETLLAKYGFANPMEGISYFANALGEKATQPFAKMMGADDRSKSIVFEPRSGKYVNVDTGLYATQAEINAANIGYGSRVSQTPLLDPSMNNFGVAGAPYRTTAGEYGNVTGGATNNYAYPGSGGGSAYKLVRDEETGKMVAPSKRQLLKLTPEEYAADIKGYDQKADIQIELARQNADKQAKYHGEVIKAAGERQAKELEIQGEYEKAAEVRSSAEMDRNAYVTKYGADSIVVAVKEAGGTSGSGTNPKGMQPGDGRKSGQLFDSNVYKDGKIVGSDPMKEIGNFGFDMLKNAAGQELTKGIKNPYAQMVANFAIQKGLNYGVEAIMKSDFITNMFSSTASDAVGSTFVDTAANWVTSLLNFAGGGPVVGPGTGKSDSIPAMLSNGEFVVNAIAAEKYRPLLDALNIQRLSEGTPAAAGSVKDMSKVLGTAETNSQLAVSNETLTSIDGSLRTISGRPSTGSGTSVTGTGLSFDTGLGAFGGPRILSSSSVMGTATGGGGGGRGRAPSTGDIVESLATSIAKSYLIKTGIGIAANAIAPGIAYEMTIANLAAGGGVSGFVAGAEVGASMLSTGIMEGLAVVGPYIPYILAAYVAYEILDSIYGGGGGSAPPPKEPKFHAAMYVVGNNNPNAITPMYETLEYHAVPDVYKTISYGLLRVAFNATKSAEAVTKITPPWDWLYMKVQFDKVALIWGKGAPSRETLAADTYADNMSWPYSTELNLNSVASDIIDRITKEFKAGLAAENANLAKLDTAATGLKNYSLDELSSGLISELKSGNLKLDSAIEKGIYASSVAESDRISSLVNTQRAKGAYITTASGAEYDSEGNEIKAATAGGESMVYSIKQGKFVKNPYGLDTILLDAQDRPVYDIEGTSAGLSIDDFVSAERAGSRTANILAPPVTAGSAAGGGATVVNAPSVVTTDASSLTNYYTTNQTTIDALRAAQTQTG